MSLGTHGLRIRLTRVLLDLREAGASSLARQTLTSLIPLDFVLDLMVLIGRPSVKTGAVPLDFPVRTTDPFLVLILLDGTMFVPDSGDFAILFHPCRREPAVKHVWIDVSPVIPYNCS